MTSARKDLIGDEASAVFVRNHIRSIWALELLLLLHVSRERHWKAATLVKTLRASSSIVQDNLSQFERHGLAVQDAEGWRFHPANPDLEAAVERLKVIYRQRPMAIIHFISRADAS